MKTVKLKDVTKGGWKVKPEDRLNLSSIENSAKVTEAMAAITSGLTASMQKQIDVIDLISKRMTTVAEGLDRRPSRLAPAAMPNIEVIMPTGKKRSFRCTPVRDDQGIIEYVDIKEI